MVTARLSASPLLIDTGARAFGVGAGTRTLRDARFCYSLGPRSAAQTSVASNARAFGARCEPRATLAARTRAGVACAHSSNRYAIRRWMRSTRFAGLTSLGASRLARLASSKARCSWVDPRPASRPRMVESYPSGARRWIRGLQGLGWWNRTLRALVMRQPPSAADGGLATFGSS